MFFKFRYYAAPTSVYNVSPYAATRLEYDEPINIPHATNSAFQRGSYEIGEHEEDKENCHYMEID